MGLTSESQLTKRSSHFISNDPVWYKFSAGALVNQCYNHDEHHNWHHPDHRPYSRQVTEQLPLSGSLHSHQLVEPTTVGSLWLENDLHENELEFESYMGRSRKNVRVTSHGIHAEIHEIWTCVAPAAPPLFHAAVNPCLQGESPWNWSCNSVNLCKSTVTWMRRHYVFTVISRWSTFSSTVDVCNIRCVIFSDTHCSFRPPILWHSPFHAGVSVY